MLLGDVILPNLQKMSLSILGMTPSLLSNKLTLCDRAQNRDLAVYEHGLCLTLTHQSTSWSNLLRFPALQEPASVLSQKKSEEKIDEKGNPSTSANCRLSIQNAVAKS